MSKYSKYLERGLQKIKNLEIEINSSRGPEASIRRLADVYLKDAQMTKYFEKYRDKGSGQENYWAFLRAKGKYFTGSKKSGREDKETRENRLIEKIKGRFHGNKKHWRGDDWKIYEFYLGGGFGDLTSEDFFLNPW